MSGAPHERLRRLGLELPPPFAPVATYEGAVRAGRILYVSGQGPVWGTEIRHQGRLGEDHDLETALEAARLTMLNVLSHVENAVGLDRVRRALSVFGLVNAPLGHPAVYDVIAGGAAVLEDLFADAGRPALSAIAASSLPMAIAVEMDAVFEIA